MKKSLVFSLFILVLTPVLVSAQTCAQGWTCLINPLRGIGASTPEEVVLHVGQAFLALVGMFAIAFVVFSGFKLIVATNEEAINEAKQSLTWSVGGFIAAILSYTIISGTANFLGFEPSRVGLGQDTLQNPVPTDSFPGIVNQVMINFLGLIGFATILMIIYHGYRYITSAGNDEAIQKAKDGLKWSLTGFVITLLSYTIINSIHLYLVRG